MPKEGRRTFLYEENTAHPLLDFNQRLEYYHIYPMIFFLNEEISYIVDLANSLDKDNTEDVNNKVVELINLTHNTVFEFVDLKNQRCEINIFDCFLKPFDLSDIDSYMDDYLKAITFNVNQKRNSYKFLTQNNYLFDYLDFHEGQSDFLNLLTELK